MTTLPLPRPLFPYARFFWVLLTAIVCGPLLRAQSLRLTGSPQWVNLGDLDVTGNQITVEALINWQSGPNVVSKHTGPTNVNYLLRPTTFEITTGSTFHLMTNPYTLQNNVWYHIAGVYDGAHIRYYVNGCLVIEETATGNMAQQNLSTAIGNISSSPNAEQFIGSIDEVRIWNVARTQAQLAANMNDLPAPGTYPNLLAYYKFNNNLLNSANGSFNGTAVGSISYGPEPPVIAQFAIASVVPVNISCFGLNNGSVTVSASGSGVQYAIDGGTYQTGNTFTGLTPGSHTVYVRSSEGCVLTQTFTLTQPAQPASTVNASICQGQSYAFAGQNYTASGTYTVTNPGMGGCDSTSTLNLTVVSASGPPPPASHFNTATNGSGGRLPGGSNDLSWRVATNSINGPYNPAIVMTSRPGSYYNSPWPDCEWIAHNATGSEVGPTSYFYRSDFTLPCFNTCGQSYADDGVFCLNLDFLADNAVLEIYVNGVPQSAQIPNIPPANPASYTGFQQANMVSVSLCNDWQPGNNTLIINVFSGGSFAGFLAQASVNPPPVLSDTVQAQICSGQSHSFGGNTYTAAGQYTVNFHTAAGCDSLVTLNLSVLPTPATPTPTSNSPVCEGSPIQLNTATVANATYAWSGPGSWTSTAQNPSLPGAVIAQSGTYTVTLSVNGCSSAPGSTQVTVNAVPATPVIGSNSPLCEGETLTFTQNAGAGATFSWNGPNAWVSGASAPQIPAVQTGQSGNYTLQVTVNGCSSAVATTPVTVNAKPVISYTGALSFCGTQALLSATGQVTTGSLGSFTWFGMPGMQPIGTGPTLSHPFTGAVPTTQQTVAVSAASEQGCRDTAFAVLTLYATPEAAFEWEDLCNGSDIRFNNLSTWNGNPQAGGSPQYGWSFGDGQTGSAGSPVHGYPQPGTYTVWLRAASPESTCADSVSREIIVHPLITLNPQAIPDACGQNVSFSVSPQPSTWVDQLHWDLGDGSTSGDSLFSHLYTEPGTYTYQLTVHTDYGCTFPASGQVPVKPVPSLSTVTLPNIITPNGDASNDAFLLDDLFADCVEYELKIINRWGGLMYTQRKGSVPFGGQSNLGGKLTPGVYFYVIRSQSEEKTGTITIAY